MLLCTVFSIELKMYIGVAHFWFFKEMELVLLCYACFFPKYNNLESLLVWLESKINSNSFSKE